MHYEKLFAPGRIAHLELKNRIPDEDVVRIVGIIRDLGWLPNVIFISFDLENLVNDNNRSVATLAIACLLKTGTEARESNSSRELTTSPKSSPEKRHKSWRFSRYLMSLQNLRMGKILDAGHAQWQVRISRLFRFDRRHRRPSPSCGRWQGSLRL